SKLFIAMLDVESGSSLLVDAQAMGRQLFVALKAAAALPVFYNRTIGVGGLRCMDAGIANTFPIEDALRAGCTDIMVLLTRPSGYRRPSPGRASRWLFDRICARGNEPLSRIYARYHERDAQLRNLAFGRSQSPAGVNIATIC